MLHYFTERINSIMPVCSKGDNSFNLYMRPYLQGYFMDDFLLRVQLPTMSLSRSINSSSSSSLIIYLFYPCSSPYTSHRHLSFYLWRQPLASRSSLAVYSRGTSYCAKNMVTWHADSRWPLSSDLCRSVTALMGMEILRRSWGERSCCTGKHVLITVCV